MKHTLLIILISFGITGLTTTGCSPFGNNSQKPSKSSYIPEIYCNIPLEAIYPDISQELIDKMLMPKEEALKLYDYSQITNDGKETYDHIDEPNTIKAYTTYKLANNILKDGIPKNEYKKAVNGLIDSADNNPQSGPIQKELARYYQNNDKIYAAIRHAKQAVSLDPNDLEAAVLCSTLYSENMRYSESLKYANLALESSQATPNNEQTALAKMQQAIALDQLGYIYASAQCHLETWQMMKYHRRFNHYREDIEDIMQKSEFYLLIAAREFLQCGMVAKSCEALSMIQYGPTRKHLTGYLTKMVTELPQSQKVRFNLLKYFYRFMLAAGGEPEFYLQMFYNNCQEMSLANEYTKVVQYWYSIGQISNAPGLISRHSYALGLEYAKNHTMARLVLKNCQANSQTAATWLDFARLDRKNKSYGDMLDGYIRCIDAGPENIASVIKELENIINLDPPARNAIRSNKKLPSRNSIGAILARALLAQYDKENNKAEKLFRQAVKKMPEDLTIRKYLLGHLASTGQFQNMLILTRGYNDFDILLYAAKACQALGDHNKAKHYYNQILSKDKYNESAVTNLASLQIALKEFYQGEELLLKTARRHPEYDNVQLSLIKLYAIRSIDNTESAETASLCYQRCTELADKWSKRFSDSPSQQKKADQLLQRNLEELLKVYNKCKVARTILCRSYLNNDKLEDAAVHAAKLTKAYQDDYEIMQLTASVFQQSKRYDQELTARKSIWNIHKQNSETLSTAMKAARLAGLPSEALDLLDSGLKKLDNDIDFINAMLEESTYTFLILRNYPYAVDLFNNWKTICQKADIESNKELYSKILHKLAIFQSYGGTYEKAAETIYQLYKFEPDHSLYPAFTLVRALNIRGMFDKSLPILDKLIELMPNEDIFLYHEYAFTLIDAGRSDDAVDYIEQFQMQRLDALNRQYILLQTYQRCGRWQDALELVKKQLRDNPEDPDLLAECVSILINKSDENSLNEAAGILDELEKSNTDPYKWFDYRIILDITLNQPHIAFERLTQMGADPDSADTKAVKARIYFLNGEIEKSIAIYENLIRDYPDNSSYHSQFSMVLESGGYIDRSIEQLQIVFEQNKDNAMSRNNLAYTMINHNRQMEKAGRLIREAIYQSPGNVAILDSVGWYYYKTGDFETAMEYIYHSASADTIVDPVVMDHLGDCLYRTSQPEKAIIYWQRGLEELNRRIMMEKYLKPFQEEIMKKINQYNNNEIVETAELFN